MAGSGVSEHTVPHLLFVRRHAIQNVGLYSQAWKALLRFYQSASNVSIAVTTLKEFLLPYNIYPRRRLVSQED